MTNTAFEQLFSLHGQFVLITGAAGLLGQKHAQAIAGAGGTPVLTDISTPALAALASRLQQQYGVTCPFFAMDVTCEESIRLVHQKLQQANTPIHTLINNAARNPAVSKDGLQQANRLENFDMGTWQQDIAVGLTGAMLCAKVFGTAMAQRGKGNIINVSSDLGVIAPDQRLYRKDGVPDDQQDVKPVTYSVIKHGLLGLTKYLATYWLGQVRCNALSPGGVWNDQPQTFLSQIQERIPMGRMAHADEYQGAIVFLASEASSYMNGGNLVIDGGRSIW